MESKDLITLKVLLCAVMADIDIFLLQNEKQTGDNDKKTFTREEVREQLTKTLHKTVEFLDNNGCSTNKPLKFDPVAQVLSKSTTP